MRWKKEVLFTSGDRYFADLIQALEQAQFSIEMESYIFEAGILAERVVETLSRARARGIRVRLIVDGWGSPGFVGALWPRLKEAGVRVHFFRVVPWHWRRFPGDPAGMFRRISRRLRQMNRGNHRKFCLIDQSELWVGSFNVSDVHLKEVYGDQAWKDAGVCVRGADLKFARRAFQRAYQGWSTPKWPGRGPKLLLLNDSYLHNRRARRVQLKKMSGARQRIWCTTPYFVPIGSLYRGLARSADAGVDVRIIIPRKNDVWFMKWVSLPLLVGLAKRGVRVYIYEPCFSHQKILICDEWVSLGSSNLNHRSFLHDLEMDVVLTHDENREGVLRSFEQDLSDSRPFDPIVWDAMPAWKRSLGWAFRILRYWA